LQELPRGAAPTSLIIKHNKKIVENIPKKYLINAILSLLAYKKNVQVSQNRYILSSNILPKKSILRSYKYEKKEKYLLNMPLSFLSYKRNVPIASNKYFCYYLLFYLKNIYLT
jgi:hypothetical protein